MLLHLRTRDAGDRILVTAPVSDVRHAGLGVPEGRAAARDLACNVLTRPAYGEADRVRSESDQICTTMLRVVTPDTGITVAVASDVPPNHWFG